MVVVPAATGSIAPIPTDRAIAGRLALFGRSVIQGAAKRIVGDMADCIKRRLESSSPDSSSSIPAPAE